MSLRYAILGFLSSTPSSGYELGRHFSEGAGAFWQAAPSQIYPELRRLEAEGLIEGEVSTADRLGRRIYSLKPAGRTDLRSWVESGPKYQPRRDPERIQLFFLDGSPRAVIRRHLLAHRETALREIEEWRAMLAPTLAGSHPQLADRLTRNPPARRALIIGLKRVVLEGNIARAEQEIAWADETIAWLATLPDSAFPADLEDAASPKD